MRETRRGSERNGFRFVIDQEIAALEYVHADDYVGMNSQLALDSESVYGYSCQRNNMHRPKGGLWNRNRGDGCVAGRDGGCIRHYCQVQAFGELRINGRFGSAVID